MFNKLFTRKKVPLTPSERRARNVVIEAVVLKAVTLFNVFAILTILIGAEAGFFWTLFIGFLVYEWDNRYVGALAILALVACPILLALEFQEDAEIMAVYAYYLLVITVVLQIIEFKRHPDSEHSNILKNVGMS